MIKEDDELIAIRPADQPYINITWQVNNFCNFKCKYCNPGNWAGKSTDLGSYDAIIRNLTKIIDTYTNKGYKGFKFYFSGGEPTVWDHLIPLIKWLKEKIDDPHIGINTNLSRSINWWEENYSLFHDVVASYHYDFADQEKFLNTFKFLQDKVNYLCARMMMQEDKFREVEKFGERLKVEACNYNLEWVPLYDDISVNVGPWKYGEEWMHDFFKTHTFESQTTIPKPRGSKYRATSIEVYKSGETQTLNGNRLTAERKNFFSGWKCQVDESLFINSRGDMSYASCGQGPSAGNIYEQINLLSESIICKKHQCTCGTDIIITKEKQ